MPVFGRNKYCVLARWVHKQKIPCRAAHFCRFGYFGSMIPVTRREHSRLLQLKPITVDATVIDFRCSYMYTHPLYTRTPYSHYYTHTNSPTTTLRIEDRVLEITGWLHRRQARRTHFVALRVRDYRFKQGNTVSECEPVPSSAGTQAAGTPPSSLANALRARSPDRCSWCLLFPASHALSLSLDRRKAQPGNVPLYKPSCLFQQVCASWWERYLVHLLRQISSTSDEIMVMIVWFFVHITGQHSLMCCNRNHSIHLLKTTNEEPANSWKLAQQYP